MITQTIRGPHDSITKIEYADDWIIFTRAGADEWLNDGFTFEVVAYEKLDMEYLNPDAMPILHPYRYKNTGQITLKHTCFYNIPTLNAAWELAEHYSDEFARELEAMFAEEWWLRIDDEE